MAKGKVVCLDNPLINEDHFNKAFEQLSAIKKGLELLEAEGKKDNKPLDKKLINKEGLIALEKLASLQKSTTQLLMAYEKGSSNRGCVKFSSNDFRYGYFKNKDRSGRSVCLSIGNSVATMDDSSCANDLNCAGLISVESSYGSEKECCQK